MITQLLLLCTVNGSVDISNVVITQLLLVCTVNSSVVLSLMQCLQLLLLVCTVNSSVDLSNAVITQLLLVCTVNGSVDLSNAVITQLLCHTAMFLPRDAMCNRGLCCRRYLSVRPSVTLVHCIQRDADIVTFLCGPGSPIILVFDLQR